VSKRLAVYGATIAVLLMAWAVANYYSTEMFAVWWHLRHGSHAEVDGIRFPVPFAYEVSESPGLPRLAMIRFEGHAWRGFGVIDIEFRKQPSPEAIELLESRGIGRKTIVGGQEATLAGKPGKCVEAIPQIGIAQLQELMRQRDTREIDCWFGGEVEVTFRGTASLRDEFYSVIRGAAAVQGKR